MTTSSGYDIDVLVVGAGPVGLSLANELGQQSVRCLVVEQRERVGYSPRAKLTNVRTAELLRRWGLADELRRASSMPRQQPSNIVFTTRLNEHVLVTFEDAFYRKDELNELFSESSQWVPQYTLEEVLRAGAARRPSIELRFNSQLVGVKQDAHGVVASIHDTRSGDMTEIRARYLVGADGGRSKVRALLHIAMRGEGAVAPNLNVLFRAPELNKLYERMPAIQYWTVNPQACALMGPVDDQGLWYVIAARLGEGVSAASPEDTRHMIRAACGIEDLEVEIVDIDPWYAHCLMAHKYAADRIFLAGDACHMHPPFGGHGMNMGIGDAMDLGWKLAASIQGWGGPALLPSYEAERRPVHRAVMDESNANYALAGTGLLRDGLEAAGEQGEHARAQLAEEIREGKRREFFNLGLVLGYRYRNSPVLPDDNGPAPEDKGLSIDYSPSSYPGSLAPHFWLDDGRSLYDTFGARFTLLADDAASDEDVAALQKAAERRHVPLTTVRLADARFNALYKARLALIRPDQHVAWRGDAAPADSDALIALVTGKSTHPVA